MRKGAFLYAQGQLKEGNLEGSLGCLSGGGIKSSSFEIS
jgi:hypothetical protein